MKKNSLDWKEYEAITKYIYETLGKEFGVKVLGYGNNCKVKGKSGNMHQIDVLTMQSNGINELRTAIECKYLKKKVNKDIVMKILSIIQDAQIDKGVIVSKSGFTKDAINYAREYNIGLTELREAEAKDFSNTPKNIFLGDFLIQIKTTTISPEILKIDIGNNQKLEIKTEWDYYDYLVILENESKIPFLEYVNVFRKEINQINEKNKIITKQFETPNAVLVNRRSKSSTKINEIIFTGKLVEFDDSQDVNFRLVDQVWLIMKSIFEERTFTFSEHGLIVKHEAR